MVRLVREKELGNTEIGKIPRDWKIKPIGKLAEFTRGFSYRGSEKFYEPTRNRCVFVTLNNVIAGGGFKREYSWIESNRIKERHFLNEGDLIIANTHFGVGGSGIGRLLGTPALVAFPNGYNKRKGVYSHHITKVTPKDPNYKSFLYWFLVATQKESASFLTGTTVRGLDIDNFQSNKLAIIPSPSEQTYIPAILSWFDSLLENKEKQNEILEKIAMANFKSWFDDFKPFRDGEFVESELGKIPKGWKIAAIDELFNLVKGKKCDLKENGHVAYLLLDTYETGNKVHWTNEKQPFVDEMDIVIVADGASSGRVFRFQKGVLGSTLLFLEQKDESGGLRHYVYLFLKYIEEELMEYRTGSAIPHLDKYYLANLKVIIPPQDTLDKFHSIVDPLFQKIIVNQKQTKVLRSVKDSLLPLLVFGRLRVKEI